MKALSSLSPSEGTQKDAATEENPPVKQPPPERHDYEYNAMASVLERHERVANRIRNRK